ncbi:MAG: hypothetical protein ACT4PV_12985 [Planctomycetaceae bacterium]
MPVAADKPCLRCGRPVHFSYKGPVEGLCGRCSDRGSRRERGRTRTKVVRVRAKVSLRSLLFAAGGAFLAGLAAGALLQALHPVF